jgi:hypothetical protein
MVKKPLKKSKISKKKAPSSSAPRRSKKSSNRKATAKKKWSQNVTENSHAMDLEQGVFSLKNPKSIAKSVLQSATESHTRKSSPYQSAMSMINFYINRAGKALPPARKKILNEAKEELRALNNKK